MSGIKEGKGEDQGTMCVPARSLFVCRHEERHHVDPMTEPARLARRQLLARLGVLGASLGVAPALLRTPPAAATTARARTPFAGVRAAQAAQASPGLTLDTMAGILPFVCPGEDPYSGHQGLRLPEPGGVA